MSFKTIPNSATNPFPPHKPTTDNRPQELRESPAASVHRVVAEPGPRVERLHGIQRPKEPHLLIVGRVFGESLRQRTPAGPQDPGHERRPAARRGHDPETARHPAGARGPQLGLQQHRLHLAGHLRQYKPPSDRGPARQQLRLPVQAEAFY